MNLNFLFSNPSKIIISIFKLLLIIYVLGYDNEEVVELGDLMPTDGETARNTQIEQSKLVESPGIAVNGDYNSEKYYFMFAKVLFYIFENVLVPIFPQDSMPLKKSKSKKKSPYTNHNMKPNGLPPLSSFKFPPFMPSLDADDSVCIINAF